jgi:hypothetical protein
MLANEFGDGSWRPASEISAMVLVIVTVSCRRQKAFSNTASPCFFR